MGGVSRTFSSQWDADGGRTGLTSSFGYMARFDYDGLDRLVGVAEGPGAPAVVSIGYDAAGRRSGMGQGPGYVSSADSYGYDSAGRLQSLGHDLAGTAWDQARTFAYNPASQVVGRTGSNDSYVWTPPYAVNRGYGVNGLNQYTATSGTGASAFQYDANGNLTSDGTSTFVYDVENRLVSAPGPALAEDDRSQQRRRHWSTAAASALAFGS
jgi:hypothetical protein